MFLRVFSADGTTLLSRQVGTSAAESLSTIAIDLQNNIYLGGQTEGALIGAAGNGGTDVFLRVFGIDGSTQLTRQFGTSGDDSVEAMVVLGDGTTYLAGDTNGALIGTSLGGSDSYMRVYDLQGTNLLTRQVGTASNDETADLRVDPAGNVYISGTTMGALVGGGFGGLDSFLRIYSSDGSTLVTRQFGTEEDERTEDMH